MIESNNNATSENFTPFTGRIIGNNVRIRLQPHLDSHILRETGNTDMFLVTKEENGFYAIKPPSNAKAYIYRTFVLDNVVEGSRVNVRLEPHLEAPVISQLSTGAPANGIVSAVNSKWLEIAMPESTRYYVAKEYVEFAGDETFLVRIEQRRNEVHHLINSAYLIAQAEIRKPFEQIDLPRITNAFEKIIKDYSDFSAHVDKSKEVLGLLHETYLQKKVAFLESKTQQSSQTWATQNEQLSQDIAAYEKRLKELEKELNIDLNNTISKNEESTTPPLHESIKEEATENGTQMEEEITQKENVFEDSSIATLELAQALPEEDIENSNALTNQIDQWSRIEKAFFHHWAADNPSKTIQDFHLEQQLNTIIVTGIIAPYSRAALNVPGNFILKDGNRTIAFLYSTKVNLGDKIGLHVTLKGNQRPNHHFAFPAYHITSAE